MPKLTQDTHEATSPVAGAFQASLVNFCGIPQLVCGVNRKANTGNFENVDIYNAIILPLAMSPEYDVEALKAAVEAGAEVGFSLMSQETYKRYATVKGFDPEEE